MNIEEKSLCPAFFILFPDHIIFPKFFNLNDYLKVDLFCILDRKSAHFLETRLPHNLFDVFFKYTQKRLRKSQTARWDSIDSVNLWQRNVMEFLNFGWLFFAIWLSLARYLVYFVIGFKFDTLTLIFS